MNKSEQKLLELVVGLFEKDIMFSSRPEIDHPYFLAIVTWGKQRPDDIIPWLLNHIDGNWRWCYALRLIVGNEKSPHIPEEHAGEGEFISKLWTEWGQANGYLIVESK